MLPSVFSRGRVPEESKKGTYQRRVPATIAIQQFATGIAPLEREVIMSTRFMKATRGVGSLEGVRTRRGSACPPFMRMENVHRCWVRKCVRGSLERGASSKRSPRTLVNVAVFGKMGKLPV
jgi:hypothetical protein